MNGARGISLGMYPSRVLGYFPEHLPRGVGQAAHAPPQLPRLTPADRRSRVPAGVVSTLASRLRRDHPEAFSLMLS